MPSCLGTRRLPDHFARVQAKRLDAGRPIGQNDTMIASHALSADCVLVTNNQKPFGLVPGLTLDNWVDPRR